MTKSWSRTVSICVYWKNIYSETKEGETITKTQTDISLYSAYTKKYQVKVKDDTIDVYKVKKSNKMGLVYGTNVANNNTGYYVYDSENDSLSKYYDEEVKAVNREILD